MALSNSARRPPAERLTRIEARAERAVKLAQTLARLQRSAGHTEELADLVGVLWEELGLSPDRLPPLSLTPPAPAPASRQAKYADPIWTTRAERGVETIRFTPHGARTTLVAINGADPVELSAGLAVLLRILSSGPRQAGDGLPAFRSYEDIAAEMAQITGRPAGVRAVYQGISRLRDWLGAMKGPSPMLVETKEVRLARFRLVGELIVD